MSAAATEVDIAELRAVVRAVRVRPSNTAGASCRRRIALAALLIFAGIAGFLHSAAFHAWSSSPGRPWRQSEDLNMREFNMRAGRLGQAVVASSSVVLGGAALAVPADCALLLAGWGDNSIGQSTWPNLGFLPVEVAAGYDHSIVRLADGGVVCVGMNNHGQCITPAGLHDAIRIAAGDRHSVALRADGSVVCWGRNEGGQCDVPVGLGTVDDISAGGSITMARRTDGELIIWGLNDFGQRAVPRNLGPITLMEAGVYHSVVKTSGGDVRAWGRNDHGQCAVPSGMAAVVQVAGGDRHSGALLADGTVRCWGQNIYGQCSVPPGLPFVVSLGLSDRYSLALDENGTVHRWGQDHGLPPAGTVLSAIAAGAYHGLGIVASTGTVCGCPADIDESGTVSGVDLAALLGVWNTDGGKYPRADIDGSGTVDAGDLAILLNSWGACP